MCIFSVTIISPKNILGIHNPKEIEFVKGKQDSNDTFFWKYYGKGFWNMALGRALEFSLYLPATRQRV